MDITYFFDKETGTLTYVVADLTTNKCAVIDPILNYDIFSGTISNDSVNQVIQYIENNGLSLQWTLETHIHADHLSAAQVLKQNLGGKIAIGEHVLSVFDIWKPIFNDLETDNLFDALLKENTPIKIGELTVTPIHTPGHSPEGISYLIEDCVFVGDTLFSPKRGTARADFTGGSAEALYHSIQKIFSLGDKVNVHICHDYPDKNSEPDYVATIGGQRKNNILINDSMSKQEFVSLRTTKDKNLPTPKLMLPAIQVNMRAGKFPAPENNGKTYLKVPLTIL